MELFYFDIKQNSSITWEKLINEINHTLLYNPYSKNTKPYDTFKDILVSLLIGEEIILLDTDFSDDELIQLTGKSEFDKELTTIDKDKFSEISNKKHLIDNLKKNNDNWRLTLFTSGTTGVPKKITHDFNSITRFVKISKNYLNSVWGFAYNPTHMAGTQVFMQSVLNGNTIINLLGLPPEKTHQQIIEHNITHISGTPTFYKLLLPCKGIFPSVLRITSGGEKLPKSLIQELKKIFPNAKITNVYASTEAGSLFASENDIFSIKSDFEKLIKVENNELLIHNSLIGHSNIKYHDWYHTGDLIEIISENPFKFRFVSRQSDIINVGGYNVNPIEVEEIILLIPGVTDVRVYSKSNSVLGNIICCEVITNDTEINESNIRSYLQTKIQEYKIPRIINFVDKLSTTRTGKIKRN